jgi:hypothetical protein
MNGYPQVVHYMLSEETMSEQYGNHSSGREKGTACRGITGQNSLSAIPHEPTTSQSMDAFYVS